MNVVTFNSASLAKDTVLAREAKNVIKLWAYFGSMSRQFTTANEMITISEGVTVNSLVATANLNFSVSNISFSPESKMPSEGLTPKVNDIPPLVSEPLYDTKYQGVREWLEEPFPVAGYQVYILADSIESAQWNIQDDMDDYIRVKLADVYKDGVFQKTVDLWIGTSKAGLTDFYTPFQGIPKSKITYLNPEKIAKHLGGVSTGGGSVSPGVGQVGVVQVSPSQLSRLGSFTNSNSRVVNTNLLTDFARL